MSEHVCWLPTKDSFFEPTPAPLNTIIACPECGQKWCWTYGYNTLEFLRRDNDYVGRRDPDTGNPIP